MADRKGRFAPGGVALFFLLMVMAGAARAATITVNTIGDPGVSGTCDLRDAIVNANGKNQSGSTDCTAGTGIDTIVFSVGGTIKLGSSLPAIANTSPGSLTIDGSELVTVDGASLFRIFSVNTGATLNLQNLTLTHGHVSGVSGFFATGGAIVNNGTLTVTNCTFSKSLALGGIADPQTGGNGEGGGIYNVGTLTVINCTFSDNMVAGGGSAFSILEPGKGFGGAIGNEGALTVSASTFSGNEAIGYTAGGMAGGAPAEGGAIFSDGPVTITDSTFSGNQAAHRGSGGAIFIEASSVTVTNSTFSGNSAASIGGGIDNAGTLTVTNNTFSGNSAVIGGGGITNEPLGHTTLKGTILGADPGGNCGGLITDAGYNISDEVSCAFSGTSVDGIALNLDPAGLRDNGGPTQTIALKSNSEAVDFIPVANCTDQSSPTPQPLITDQRGLPRPDPGNPDFCDAGAFELQTTPFVLVPNSEKVQIARSMSTDSDKVNMAFSFTENGFPACDAADDAFDGFFVVIESGTCAVHDHASLLFFLNPWVVHTVNHASYGTLFSSFPPGSLSARMVELPTPAAPACGEWTLNLEIAGIDSVPLGDGPFSLILSKPNGDTECFDITDAIVGSQIPTPGHGVRRRVRRR